MIVESPNPSCVSGSQFSAEIKQVRKTIEAKSGVIHGRRQPNVPVTVTGVAFFDLLHGQEGVAANAIELDPLLAITFQ